MLIFAVTASGCTILGTKKNSLHESTKFVKTGIIVDAERIKKGGNLLIIPFKAGENVELNDQIDKAALRIVKGISESLIDGDSNFKILLAHNADEADIIIKGFITEFGTVPKWKKWGPFKKKISLRIEGKMIDLKSQNTVCVFQDSRTTSKKEDDHNSLGLTIGRNIGQFILSDDK